MRLFGFGAFFFASPAALAQPGGPAALYASGDAALGDGRNEDALRDCQAAVALLADGPKEQLGRAEFCVARAASALERYATAVESAASAFRHIDESGATARRYRADREAAARMVVELTPRISYLDVEIQPPDAREHAALVLNGHEVPSALVGASIPVDAGAFEVRVSSEGFEDGEARGTVEVAGRQSQVVRLVKKRVVLPPPPPEPLRLLLGAELGGGAALQTAPVEIVVGAGALAGFDVYGGAFLALRISGATEPENPEDLAFVAVGLELVGRLWEKVWIGGAFGYGYSFWKDLKDRDVPACTDPTIRDPSSCTGGEVEGIALSLDLSLEIRRVGFGTFTVGTISSVILGDRTAFLFPLLIGFRTF